MAYGSSEIDHHKSRFPGMRWPIRWRQWAASTAGLTNLSLLKEGASTARFTVSLSLRNCWIATSGPVRAGLLEQARDEMQSHDAEIQAVLGNDQSHQTR